MFEGSCGVGIVVTADDIKNEVGRLLDNSVYYIGCLVLQVTRVIDEHRVAITDKGYQFNISTLISEYK